jgi:hypothetical protein
MPTTQCTELRIGASAATLLYLRYRGIPDPDGWTYTPYSITRTDGNGQQKGYGYPTATWTWETLGQMPVGKLLDFFAANTDASVQVYISTYTDTGNTRSTTDYTAYMQRPVDGEAKEMFPGSGGNVFRDVTVTFTHLEAA